MQSVCIQRSARKRWEANFVLMNNLPHEPAPDQAYGTVQVAGGAYVLRACVHCGCAFANLELAVERAERPAESSAGDAHQRGGPAELRPLGPEPEET